MTSSAEINDK